MQPVIRDQDSCIKCGEKSSDVSVFDVWHVTHDFGVSARILAYQVRLEYVWKYRIRGCFHPVHVHFSVFLEPTLSSLHSIHDKAVPATGVCLPARATGVVTRFLLHDDAASVMRPCSVMRGDDSAPAQAEMMRGDDSAPAQAEMCAL